MNERIRQLMEQAGLYDFVIESMGVNEEMEKFAELIIEDCIRTLRSNGYDDAAKCLQDIHFGIENPV